MRNKITYLDYVFYDVTIASGTIGLETSLPISSLAIDTFEVEVKCQDKAILKFTQNTPLEYYYRGKKKGVFYVQNIKRVSPDHYSIYAISTLGLVAQHDHHGGIYTGQTVDQVVHEICGDIPVIVKTNLREIQLYGWLPIRNARANLAEVLFAIGANLGTDHNGVLRVETLWDGMASVIDADRVYQDGNSVEQNTPVTSVTVLEHQYILGTERQELFNGTATQGQVIPFSQPMHDLQAQGFTIIESNANYAIISAGGGSLTGIPYIHTTIEVTRQVSEEPVKNEIRLEEATLVSLVNSSAVADRMAAYYACGETISFDAVLQQESPGEVVNLIHPWDKTMVSAAIKSSTVEMSAVLKASMTALVDFKPAQQDDVVVYEHHEVITQSGSWTVPEGCYKVRAVLIGGGDRGTDGEDGSAGGSGGRNRGGAAGTSGAGGIGGEGGKILDVTIDVQPGQVLPITIGPGGSVASPVGGNTTFAGHSSAEGEASAIGYTDVVSGTVYGKHGEAGQSAKTQGAGTASGSELRAQFLNLRLPGTVSDMNLIVGSKGRAGDSGPFSTAHAGFPQNEESSGTHLYCYYDVDFYSATGYEGISPQDRASATVPGCGGDGGHGAGGGAGASGYSPSVSNGSELYSFTYEGTTFHWMIRNLIDHTAAGAKGGIGGKAGNGAPGVLILYYGVEMEKAAGALVTARKNFFIDRTGRLFIV